MKANEMLKNDFRDEEVDNIKSIKYLQENNSLSTFIIIVAMTYAFKLIYILI